jgi:hypothetical protein
VHTAAIDVVFDVTWPGRGAVPAGRREPRWRLNANGSRRRRTTAAGACTTQPRAALPDRYAAAGLGFSDHFAGLSWRAPGPSNRVVRIHPRKRRPSSSAYEVVSPGKIGQSLMSL